MQQNIHDIMESHSTKHSNSDIPSDPSPQANQEYDKFLPESIQWLANNGEELVTEIGATRCLVIWLTCPPSKLGKDGCK
jgi:hypothetical protein